MRQYTFISIFIMLFLIGCRDKILEGYIAAKEYEPASTYVVMQTVPIGEDQSITVPMTIYDDEDFILILEGYTEKGEFGRQKVWVTKSVYESVRVGDSFVTNETTEFEDTNEKSRAD